MRKYELDDAGDFGEGGIAVEDREEAFLLESEHAVRDGGLLDGVCVDVGDVAADEALDGFVDDELLHDDVATIVAKRILLTDDGVVEGDIV